MERIYREKVYGKKLKLTDIKNTMLWNYIYLNENYFDFYPEYYLWIIILVDYTLLVHLEY